MIAMCPICKKEVDARGMKKYCSPECARIGNLKCRKQRREDAKPKPMGDWYTKLCDVAADALDNCTTYGKLTAPSVEVYVPRNLMSAKERQLEKRRVVSVDNYN